MNIAIKYVAELTDVREVSLTGTAEAGYWREALRADDLVPVEREGKAQIVVTSCESRFAGVGVRELSFCVRVDRAGSRALPDAVYLVQAFNSNRFFAFCERVFFSTPYVHGDVRLGTGPLPFVELRLRGDVVFRVEMGGEGRQPSGSSEREWEVPVFLPRRGRGAQADRMFFARIEGPTRTYAFAAGQDAVRFAPGEVGSVFRSLIDSRFAVEEWEIREGATHLKSKTYARSAGLALLD